MSETPSITHETLIPQEKLTIQRLDEALGANVAFAYEAGVNGTGDARHLTAWTLALERINTTGNAREAAVTYAAANEAFAPERRHDARIIADRHFGKLLEAGETKNAEALAERLTRQPIDVRDIVKVTATDLLGIDKAVLKAMLGRISDPKSMRESLSKLVDSVYGESDSFHAQALHGLIDGLHFDGAKPLDRGGRKALRKLVELRNATWRATKVSEAIEKQDFAPLDQAKMSEAHTLREHLWNIYTGHLRKAGKSDEALWLSALEVGLDGRMSSKYMVKEAAAGLGEAAIGPSSSAE